MRTETPARPRDPCSPGAQSAPAGELGNLVLTNVVAPDSGVDPADATRLLAAFVEAHPKEYALRPVLGLARYRSGRVQEALDLILPVATERQEWRCVSTTWPMLALAYHRLGDEDEARKWLEKALEFRRRSRPTFGRDPIASVPPWGGIWDWIDFELLTREAQATIPVASGP